MFENAVAYERFMGRWSRLVARGLLEYVRMDDASKVLDVGSGTGSLSRAICEYSSTAHVVGIDPSKEFVEYAASKNPWRDRMSFEVGDAQQLPFENASFDAALSLLVFNFIPNPRKALSEVRRVIKPGGVIAAAVWDYGGEMGMLRTFWDAAFAIDPTAERLDEKNMRLCRRGELAALWEQSGLQEVCEEAIEIVMRFADFADFWEPFLLGQGPAGSYARGLSTERLEALRSDLERRLNFSAGSLVLPARAWAARGIVSF